MRVRLCMCSVAALRQARVKQPSKPRVTSSVLAEVVRSSGRLKSLPRKDYGEKLPMEWVASDDELDAERALDCDPVACSVAAAGSAGAGACTG